ncbi:MAG: SpoIIE family protein phosphatase [Gemmataceae bacterium]
MPTPLDTDARLLNDRLRAAYRERAALAELARKALQAVAPRRLPAAGRLSVGASARGGQVDAVRPDPDHLAVWLTDAGGAGTAAGGLVGLLVRGLVTPREVHDSGARLVPPAEVLARVNRGLLDLRLDSPPLVGLGYLLADARTGIVTLSRGGLPPAVYLPAGGEPAAWVGGGPFLGAFDADFPEVVGELHPGDKLVLATAAGDRLPELAGRHRRLPAHGLAYTVAAELGAEVVVIEFAA